MLASPSLLPKGLRRKLQQAIDLTLQGEGVEPKGVLSVVLSNDATIRNLNRQFLGHDYPTDVLSFLLASNASEAPSENSCEEEVWGEIIISVETAQRNARRYRQPLEKEILRLAIHGVLHLLGYDDATPKQRQHMRRKERTYLTRLSRSAV